MYLPVWDCSSFPHVAQIRNNYCLVPGAPFMVQLEESHRCNASVLMWAHVFLLLSWTFLMRCDQVLFSVNTYVSPGKGQIFKTIPCEVPYITSAELAWMVTTFCMKIKTILGSMGSVNRGTYYFNWCFLVWEYGYEVRL